MKSQSDYSEKEVSKQGRTLDYNYIIIIKCEPQAGGNQIDLRKEMI